MRKRLPLIKKRIKPNTHCRRQLAVCFLNYACVNYVFLLDLHTWLHVYSFYSSLIEISFLFIICLLDRCPVFNVVAKTMDTTSCLQTRCPPYNYRSNDIDVGKCMRHYDWHLFNSLLILNSTTHLPPQKIHKTSLTWMRYSS